MASSAFAAFADRFRSLTGVVRLFTFDAPDSIDAEQVYPNYAVLLDGGTTPAYEMELTALEVTMLTLMFYCDTLDTVDAQIEIAKYNGGGIADKLGLDFGPLPTLDVAYGNLEVRRLSEKHFLAQSTGKNSQRIFGAELQYRVSLYRYSANA